MPSRAPEPAIPFTTSPYVSFPPSGEVEQCRYANTERFYCTLKVSAKPNMAREVVPGAEGKDAQQSSRTGDSVYNFAVRLIPTVRRGRTVSVRQYRAFLLHAEGLGQAQYGARSRSRCRGEGCPAELPNRRFRLPLRRTSHPPRPPRSIGVATPIKRVSTAR